MSESQLLPDGRILRYSFRERSMHWLAGLTYLYLLLTGLAFWSPWLFWIAVVLGGGNGSNSRELHPWVGLLFSFAVFWMYGVWHSHMRSTPADKAWWKAIGKYVRNEDEEVPAEGRFNAGQKSLFWGFFWSTIVLLATGLVLWFTDSLPWSLRWLRFVSVLLHPIAALVTIALFMIHVYMGTAVERGAFGSVVRGDVSRAWARKHHRLWYEEVAGERAAKK